MEKIGDFAKRCQTTIKTLRYYDQLNLLVPDYIDKFTHYRYYGPGKVEEMHRITELKDIGFTLEEIKQYCDAGSIKDRNMIINEKQRALVKLAEDTAHQMERLKKIKQKLRKEEKKMVVNINAPFENDERVIGRWEFIATVPKKEHFKPDGEYNNATVYDELYFLPDGESYWGFSWTKGYLKISFDDGLVVPYELGDVEGQTYMFIEHPSYGGVWVLRQTDTKRYTVYSIARNDDVDLPFVDDPAVHGMWTSIYWMDKIEDFNPNNTDESPFPMRNIEFLPNGVFEWTWQSTFQHRWTTC